MAAFSRYVAVFAGAAIDIADAFLSTFWPPNGPTVEQLPALSHTSRLLVAAFAFSVLAETLVTSEKLTSAGSASPEPLSLAVHGIETSLACQRPSVEPQITLG